MSASAQSFDHTVHHRDPKTGVIKRVTPYSMECHGAVRFYRREGRCYDAAGVEIEDPKIKGQPQAGNFTRSKIAVAPAPEAPKSVTVGGVEYPSAEAALAHFDALEKEKNASKPQQPAPLSYPKAKT